MPRHVIDPSVGKATQFKSGSQAAENGRKGGQNTQAKLKRLKNSKELMLAVMNARPQMDAKAKANLSRLGVTGFLNGMGYSEDEYTLELIATAAIVQKAMQGNVMAFKEMIEIAGEKPVDKVVVVSPDKEVADSVEAALFGGDD